MKKILITAGLLSLAFSYQECGKDKKEALNNLASSIYTQVSNNFQKEESYSQNSFFNFFSKNIKTEVSQTSNVTLQNVHFFKQNGFVCAEISKEDLIKSALAAKKDVLNFNLSDLPTDFKLKLKKAKELNNKISFVKIVLGNRLSSYELRKLNSLQKKLNDILNKSEVIFNVNIPNAKIKISGIDKTFSPSEPIILNEGSYSYEIKVNGKCPVTGNFTVKKGEIKKVDAVLGDYPQIVINSKVNAVATINKTPVPLNTPYTIKKCSGAAIYEIRYQGDTESGTINLAPNLKKEISANFLTAKEKKALNRAKNVYEKAKGIEISYGYALSDNEKWDKDKRISVKGFRNYGIYQLGAGITAGSQEKFTAKAMNEAELFASFRIQVPEYQDTPLRIGSFLFVPYIGVDGGWDFYKFVKDISDKGYWKGSNITTIVRGNIGFNIMLHRQLGIDVKYSHDFMEKKDNILSAGLIMQY